MTSQNSEESENQPTQEVSDDALELAAGGIILSKYPSQTTNNSYTYNSTIYFQSSVSDEY